jgi:hypothetical protein
MQTPNVPPKLTLRVYRDDVMVDYESDPPTIPIPGTEYEPRTLNRGYTVVRVLHKPKEVPYAVECYLTKLMTEKALVLSGLF